MTDIFLEKPDPFKELTFVFGTFGWETRLCDLSKQQVEVLIFALQQATPIEEGISIDQLEENYFKSTGSWPSTSVPF